MNPAFFVKGFLSLSVLSGIFGSFYHSSKVKVFDERESFFLPRDLDEATPWKLAQDKLRNSSRDQRNYLSKPFRELRALLHKPDAPSNTAGERIKKLCLEVYDMDFKNFFYSDYDLSTDAQNFCSVTFYEMLEYETVLDATEDNTDSDDDWKKNYEELKKFQGPTLFDSQPTLDEELKAAKSDTGSDNWKKLKAWCEKAYEKRYQNSSDNDWRLTYKFCRQITPPRLVRTAIISLLKRLSSFGSTFQEFLGQLFKPLNYI